MLSSYNEGINEEYIDNYRMEGVISNSILNLCHDFGKVPTYPIVEVECIKFLAFFFKVIYHV